MRGRETEKADTDLNRTAVFYFLFCCVLANVVPLANANANSLCACKKENQTEKRNDNKKKTKKSRLVFCCHLNMTTRAPAVLP